MTAEKIVSILVFLEWALSPDFTLSGTPRDLCFNPCFLGMGAFTALILYEIKNHFVRCLFSAEIRSFCDQFFIGFSLNSIAFYIYFVLDNHHFSSGL